MIVLLPKNSLLTQYNSTSKHPLSDYNFDMSEAKALESLKFLSDWAKWLTTIETGVIALIGSFFTSDKVRVTLIDKVNGILAVSCFVFSIIAAAMLLWTLPEIAQKLRPNMNIWATEDSVAKRLFRLNTQGFAVLMTLFFILGLLFLTALVFSIIWSR